MASDFKTKAIVAISLLVSALAPFVQDLLEYLEGREILSFGIGILSSFACFFLGPLCGLVVLVRSIFDRSLRNMCLVVGLLLFIGSPVYYFTVVTPGATMELYGLADEAKNKIDLSYLQNWAVQTMNNNHGVGPTNSLYDPSQLRIQWDGAPADARAFIGTNGSAFIEFWNNGQANIALAAGEKELRVGATNFTLETDRFWTFKLKPGIYVIHNIRP
jgi:hypothetical protein